MEMSTSVKAALKDHQKMIEEGTRRIKEYQLTKFDTIQFARMLKDPTKLQEVSTDLQQKIFGPEFCRQLIQTQYAITKKLSQVTLAQFSLYVQATQESYLSMFMAMGEKTQLLIENLIRHGDAES